MPAQNNNMQENMIGVCGSDFSNHWVVPRTVGGVWCSGCITAPCNSRIRIGTSPGARTPARRGGPTPRGRDEGHHDVGPPSSSSSSAAAASAAASAAAASAAASAAAASATAAATAASVSRGRGRGVAPDPQPTTKVLGKSREALKCPKGTAAPPPLWHALPWSTHDPHLC